MACVRSLTLPEARWAKCAAAYLRRSRNGGVRAYFYLALVHMLIFFIYLIDCLARSKPNTDDDYHHLDLA